MYPKPQQARASSNHSTTRHNKREQLTDLLVNKFRNKYAINLQQEQDLARRGGPTHDGDPDLLEGPSPAHEPRRRSSRRRSA